MASQEHTVTISVLMSVYNGEKFIQDSITSILQQSYTDFEFIIVNDGSKDDSEKRILSFKDPRIVYLNNETNLGLIKSLNRGLALAKGQYIARMDADDVAFPTRLIEQLSVFEQHKKAVLVGSDYVLWSGLKKKRHFNINNSSYLKTLLLFAPCFAHPTVMIKNVFKSGQFKYNEAFLHTEDYKLWTELVAQGEFYNVNRPLLWYREHQGQVSTVHRKTQIEMCAKIREQFLQSSGFKFKEQQLSLHNLVANNQKIESETVLLSIEAWFKELLMQNKILKTFEHEGFELAIHKFWLDSCGFTNLGVRAYRIYQQSELSQLRTILLSERFKLIGKCILRKF